MKRFCVFVLISVTVVLKSVSVIGESQLYSTRWNNLNIDQILTSDRLVTNYVDCLLSRKPCPPEGKDLKRILPEALRTKCARCSTQQFEGAIRVITKLYYDYPTQYNRLRSKWDPTGEYHRRFEEYLRGLQFNSINGDSVAPQSPAKNQPPYVASASSNNQNIIPTALPTAPQPFLNNTQRPARNPEIAPNPSTSNSVAPPVGVFNRFGADDDDSSSGDSVPSSTTVGPAVSVTTLRPMPTIAAVPSQRTTQPSTRRPATAQPDVVYIQTQHPLIGLINTIGFKISNTADFFAGMLRGTIQCLELLEKWKRGVV